MNENEIVLEASLTALKLLYDSGIDEIISESPIDRFKNATATNTSNSTNLLNEKSFSGLEKRDERNSNEKREPEETFRSNLVSLAIKQSQLCDTLEDLETALKDFKYFRNVKCSERVSIFEGNPKANLMVLEEPIKDNNYDHELLDIESRSILFDRIFRSIGFDKTKTNHNSLCVVSSLPWALDEYDQNAKFNLELMKPFLKRSIELVKPKYLVLIGTTVLEIFPSCISGNGNFGKIENTPALNIPSLDVLIRAPERKREVWRNLLLLKSEISKMDKTDG